MAANINTAMLASPGEIEHAEPTAFGLNAGGYVALAMIVVVAILLWKGGARAIGRSLDKKIAAIREQLDEATKLRAEAENLRIEYQARSQEADAQARSILDHAQAEAAAIVAKAHEDTEALVARRARMAEDRIEAAERQALAAVRARAAQAAVQAAARLIGERHDARADKGLVDRTIGGLGQRLN
jgi:F-type H+-transporting ATPase subunit b